MHIQGVQHNDFLNTSNNLKKRLKGEYLFVSCKLQLAIKKN